ncbi:complement component 1 q subcomponent-binding protein [Dermatophagoides farinae]|uniref:Complement component 1 q subcomponent-binding protein n=1 Tax=Dermatophagoides farinae TaxID=6954 RepID=A0A9D4NY93_DERFA|nr:conserved regulator of innate immunity protein 3-like [Dermatophagoides farinae]KAH7639650.1 complement component 1 q subcomponent-binding protein [Dermatophagoides farinae]
MFFTSNVLSMVGRQFTRKSFIHTVSMIRQPLPAMISSSSKYLIQKQQQQQQQRSFVSNVSLNKREQELTDFLASEIDLERESQKKPLPKMSDWTITNTGSDIVLFKKFNNEEITIKANVCYSVDAANPDADNGQMVCKPEFAIEIKKGDSILGLNCSFMQDDENVDDGAQRLEDDFQINEISIYEGEFQKSSYAISGEVIDGNLYDLLMNVLEGRGIDQQFAKKLIEYSTIYEHNLYVGLLENMKKFFSN